MRADSPNPISDDDLDWLAFCYINDELEANQLVAFELQLSEDQSAREAVERAVHRQILISAGLQADGSGSKESVSVSLSRDFGPRMNQGRRPLVAKFVFASAACLLVALVSWTQWGHLVQRERLVEVADKRPSNSEAIESEEWISSEEYANQVVEALVASDPESFLNVSSADEFNPVTLQGDWMQDVFSEFGDEWIDHEDIDESNMESTESDRSWG
jgi:hypothetical protein